MDGTLTILGCGGSAGVPTVGNHWGACDPDEPRNVRTRSSIALQTQTTLVIVDASPDFRFQMNREKLGCPDALIITHEHFDHISGIDELRVLQRLHRRTFPLYASAETMERLHHRMDYMFETREGGFYPRVCEPVVITPGQTVTVGDLSMRTFHQKHGSIWSLGLRLGDVAYSTDVKSLDEAALEILQGTKTWVVDGCGYQNSANPVHASISDVIAMNEHVGAAKIFLTHMPHTMDYATLTKELPPGYAPAYDGMTLSFTATL